jgi:hypothetical protein
MNQRSLVAKYDPLRRHMEEQTKDEILMNFTDVERVLGSTLPPSARTHRAWWGNESTGSHVHCRSWLDAGYSVDKVDFVRERVTFKRNGY